MAGETNLLLNEEPVGWAITRGTTSDENKFIPMTPTDLENAGVCRARGCQLRVNLAAF